MFFFFEKLRNWKLTWWKTKSDAYKEDLQGEMETQFESFFFFLNNKKLGESECSETKILTKKTRFPGFTQWTVWESWKRNAFDWSSAIQNPNRRKNTTPFQKLGNQVSNYSLGTADVMKKFFSLFLQPLFRTWIKCGSCKNARQWLPSNRKTALLRFFFVTVWENRRGKNVSKCKVRQIPAN